MKVSVVNLSDHVSWKQKTLYKINRYEFDLDREDNTFC